MMASENKLFPQMFNQSIELPSEVYELINSDKDIGIFYTLYQKPSLFPVTGDFDREGYTVGSPVVGAAIAEMDISDLLDPVVIKLQTSIEVRISSSVNYCWYMCLYMRTNYFLVQNYSEVLPTACVSWNFTARGRLHYTLTMLVLYTVFYHCFR